MRAENQAPSPDVETRPGWHRELGAVAAWWGVLGTLLILGYAIVRLTPFALDMFNHPLAWYHWVLLAGNIAFMAYSEGYRGFQRSFSPRVAQRAASLRTELTWLRVTLAPLYCIGYFHSSRRVKTTVYALTCMIIVLVQIVHRLDQPWRGLIDAGVVIGLIWGAATTLILSAEQLSAPPEA